MGWEGGVYSQEDGTHAGTAAGGPGLGLWIP